MGKKEKTKTSLNTTEILLPFYFMYFLHHKKAKKSLNLNQVLDLHLACKCFFFRVVSLTKRLVGRSKSINPRKSSVLGSVSHLAPTWQTSRWVLLTPPACQLLFSSGCICLSGAAEAARVNVAVKKARQLQALKVQEGACRTSTSSTRQNGSVFVYRKSRGHLC